MHSSPPMTVKCCPKANTITAYICCRTTDLPVHVLPCKLGSKYLLLNLFRRAATPLISVQPKCNHPASNAIPSNRYHSLTMSPQSTLPMISPLSPHNHHLLQLLATGFVRTWPVTPASQSQTNTHDRGSDGVWPLENQHSMHPQPHVILWPIMDPDRVPRIESLSLPSSAFFLTQACA
jgi:hypothetical protein